MAFFFFIVDYLALIYIFNLSGGCWNNFAFLFHEMIVWDLTSLLIVTIHDLLLYSSESFVKQNGPIVGFHQLSNDF
jgi:hypothetical protein